MAVYIDVSQFNSLFQSDIVELPSSLFALGFKDGGSYIYNMALLKINIPGNTSEQTIDFLLSVTFSKYSDRPPEDFYCIICALDGYVELVSHLERIPRKIRISNVVINHLLIFTSEIMNILYFIV